MPRGREVGILQYNDNKRFGLVTQNSFLLGYYFLFLREKCFFTVLLYHARIKKLLFYTEICDHVKRKKNQGHLD